MYLVFYSTTGHLENNEYVSAFCQQQLSVHEVLYISVEMVFVKPAFINVLPCIT